MSEGTYIEREETANNIENLKQCTQNMEEELSEERRQRMRENARIFEKNTENLKKKMKRRNRKLTLLTCGCSIQ